MKTSAITRPVLVLNSSFEPIAIASMKRALKMVVKGVALIVESNGKVLYTKRMWDENTGEYIDVDITMPSVVKLVQYRKIPIRIQVLTRKNIYVRDNYTCFAAGTRILMGDGTQKPIEKIAIGDVVIDANGFPTTVVNLGNRISLPAELRHRGSNAPTITTLDHEYLTPAGYVPISSKPKYLVFPRKVNYQSQMEQTLKICDFFPDDTWFKFKNGRIYWTKRPHEQGLPPNIRVDENFSYILGLFVGDGSTAKSSYNVAWSFNIDQKQTLVNDVKSWVASLGLSASEYSPKKGKGLNVVVSNKMLTTIFRSLCGDKGVNKKVPTQIIGPYSASFLRGLFSSDGYIKRDKKKIVLQMVSHEAILGSQALLWGLGIYPTFSVWEPKNNEKSKRKTTFKLILQGQNYSKFMRIVMNEDCEDRKESTGDSEFIYRRFKSIIPSDKPIIVYNFETESHSYIANGLSVHNCQYCGRHFTHNELTLDHVIPQSRGGGKSYNNLVTACKPCNRLKDDVLLSEGVYYPTNFQYKEMRGQRMELLRTPRPATIHTGRQIIRNMGKEDPLWKKYLYYEEPSHNLSHTE